MQIVPFKSSTSAASDFGFYRSPWDDLHPYQRVILCQKKLSDRSEWSITVFSLLLTAERKELVDYSEPPASGHHDRRHRHVLRSWYCAWPAVSTR